MDKDKALPVPPGDKPLTVGGFSIDGKFHEIKISWWYNPLAKFRLWRSGWKFRQVGYDEFRRIVDEQNQDGG